jgi:hypothetical protein
MSRKVFALFCASFIALVAQACDNECCSVTPETRYAHIELFPDSIHFIALDSGSLPGARKAFIFNSGSSCLGWKAVCDPDWLECRPDSGFTGICGETDTLSIAPATTSLATGNHRGNITIISPHADNDPRSISVLYSIVSIEDILVIRDAWWTDGIDADTSGCPESARLTWDADALDGASWEVSAQVFYRAECTEQWKHYYTTGCYTIEGESTDDAYFVTVDNLPRGDYEFQVVLYRCGGSERTAERDQEDDPDLDNICFESLVTYSIYDAWWTDEVDKDGDGCRDSGRLAWDADVDEGLTRTVQAHLYYRRSGETAWTYYRSTACYDITGKNRDDAYYMTVEGIEPGEYEFIIDLFECDGNGKAAQRSFEDDHDLAGQCFDDYVPPATGYRIRDVWWRDAEDADGDGYYERAVLVWDPDVDDGTVGRIVSEVWFVVIGTDDWIYAGETDCTTVSGVDPGDSCSLEISGLDRGCRHFTIYNYACATHEYIFSIYPVEDEDLLEACFEPGGQSPVNAALPGERRKPAADVRKAKEGRAPLNPYGGVKEPDPRSNGSAPAREGRGSPRPR